MSDNRILTALAAAGGLALLSSWSWLSRLGLIVLGVATYAVKYMTGSSSNNDDTGYEKPLPPTPKEDSCNERTLESRDVRDKLMNEVESFNQDSLRETTEDVDDLHHLPTARRGDEEVFGERPEEVADRMHRELLVEIQEDSPEQQGEIVRKSPYEKESESFREEHSNVAVKLPNLDVWEAAESLTEEHSPVVAPIQPKLKIFEASEPFPEGNPIAGPKQSHMDIWEASEPLPDKHPIAAPKQSHMDNLEASEPLPEVHYTSAAPIQPNMDIWQASDPFSEGASEKTYELPATYTLEGHSAVGPVQSSKELIIKDSGGLSCTEESIKDPFALEGADYITESTSTNKKDNWKPSQRETPLDDFAATEGSAKPPLFDDWSQ